MTDSSTPAYTQQSPLGAPWGPFAVRQSPGQMLRLTLGSSVAVATALAVTDAFAILPTAVNGVTWLVRVSGLWLCAYILWAVGFLGILHLTRIITGGIRLDSEGLNLWRFGKKVLWKDVVALTVAERKNFSRLLFISPTALELTIYTRKAKGKGYAAKKLPSFQYDPKDFAALIYHAGRLSFNLSPSSVGVCMMQADEANALLKASQQARLKSVALSAIITSSLLLVLARNAATNYTYNMGNVYFRKAEYKKAIEYYTMSTVINPFFPPAWDRLARCDLRSGDPDSAIEHWKRALQVKPDFVESKLGLSVIYMRRWQLAEAQRLVEQCIRLAPKDEAGFINLAQIKSLTGKHKEAITLLEQIITQNRGRELGRCLLAQCYLRVGDEQHARQILLDDKHQPDASSKEYWNLVRAELALAEHDTSLADQLLTKLSSGDRHVDLLIDTAKLKLEQGDLATAEKLLLEAEKKQIGDKHQDEGSKSPPLCNPWIQILKAKIAFKRHDEFNGQWLVEQALKSPYEDPSVMAACAALLIENGKIDRAKELLDKASTLDAQNLNVLKTSNKLKRGSS